MAGLKHTKCGLQYIAPKETDQRWIKANMYIFLSTMSDSVNSCSCSKPKKWKDNEMILSRLQAEYLELKLRLMVSYYFRVTLRVSWHPIWKTSKIVTRVCVCVHVCSPTPC